jgi:misacylated tRNA(Ala) deacylase
VDDGCGRWRADEVAIPQRGDIKESTMAVPGRSQPTTSPPPELADTELFAVDAYRREFEAEISEIDREGGRVLLSRTAFFPGGGGQPHDVGWLSIGDKRVAVGKAGRDAGRVWHWIESGSALANAKPGDEVFGELDWPRRHLTMRTHTALHILCGVIWEEYKIPVTGGNMDVGTGRLDFPFEAMSAELGERMERRINDEVAAARDIVVEFLGRDLADDDPALIRTSANLIPRSIDPLRIIDIVGLDKQADGGTHVLSTAEVGRVRVTGTESKGKGNKRIRIAVEDPSDGQPAGSG